MELTRKAVAGNRFAARSCGLRIGERFLMAFDDPDLSATHQGRLQDLNSRYLCIDAPDELRPPRGTSVTISNLQTDRDEFSFSTKILGRRRLNGQLPVLLVRPPEQIQRKQRRTSYRVSVSLRTRIEWVDETGATDDQHAVLTNLSGGGGQLYLRSIPPCRHHPP